MQLSGCLWFRASHEVLFGLLSHLMARLGWVWQNCSKAHSRVVGSRPMGLPHRTSAASSRTSDPRGSERECPRWKPQSSHNLISKGWLILLLLPIGWNQVNMSSPHPRGGDYTSVEKPRAAFHGESNGVMALCTSENKETTYLHVTQEMGTWGLTDNETL